MRPTATLAAVLLACLLSACAEGPACSDAAQKADILGLAQRHYLYPELLPSPVSLTDHAGETAQEFLDSLTAAARAAGKDRGWSYLMAEDVYRRYAEQATSVGFGLSLQATGEAPALRVLVKQVFAGSPAATAGFLRGDELLAVGPDAAGLVEVAGLTGDEVSARLSAGGAAGVHRTVRVLPRGGAAEELRTMASADHGVDPVPARWISGGVGYVQLRTFIPAAEEALREAFAAFQAAGVEGVVVDLRYNGGGYVDTAEVLANLLGGGLAGREMYRLEPNAAHAAQGGAVSFGAEAAASAFKRVAFVTTSASASASELVSNVLDAYPSDVAVAFVGARTYGKPVGQYVFSLSGCNTLLFLVSFRLVNAVGNADYFEGLPDAGSSAPLCSAADDLAIDQESADEPSTAAAVHFAQHGECPPAAAGLRAGRSAAADPLRAAAGAPAGIEMPGTL